MIYDKYGTIVIGMIFDKKSCIQERWWFETDFIVFILKQSTLFVDELEFTLVLINHTLNTSERFVVLYFLTI